MEGSKNANERRQGTESHKKAYFIKYVKQIEIEIFKRGFRLNQSIIIGFITELMLQDLIKRKDENDFNPRDNSPVSKIIGNPEEITEKILWNRFPNYFDSNGHEEKEFLNFYEKVKTKIGKKVNSSLNIKRGIKLQKTYNNLNLSFSFFLIFVGMQSLYPLLIILASNSDLIESFRILDGDYLFLPQLWNTQLFYIISVGIVIQILLSYIATSLYYVRVAIPELKEWHKTNLKYSLSNYLNILFLTAYMILGSISKINGERINGLDPSKDLAKPIVILFITIFFSILNSIYRMRKIKPKRRKEKLFLEQKSSWNKVIVYLNYGLSAIFSLIVFNTARIIILNQFDENLFIVIDGSFLNFFLIIDPFITFLNINFLILFIRKTDKEDIGSRIKIQLIFQLLLTLMVSPLILVNYYNYNQGIDYIYGADYLPYVTIYITILKYILLKFFLLIILFQIFSIRGQKI